MDGANPQLAGLQTVYERETQLVLDLRGRLSTRREQASEWTRLTGKSRRTFNKRVAMCEQAATKASGMEA